MLQSNCFSSKNIYLFIDVWLSHDLRTFVTTYKCNELWWKMFSPSGFQVCYNFIYFSFYFSCTFHAIFFYQNVSETVSPRWDIIVWMKVLLQTAQQLAFLNWRLSWLKMMKIDFKMHIRHIYIHWIFHSY